MSALVGTHGRREMRSVLKTPKWLGRTYSKNFIFIMETTEMMKKMATTCKVLNNVLRDVQKYDELKR